MDSYRAMHHARYLEREREIEERVLLAEAAEKARLLELAKVESIRVLVQSIRDKTSIDEVHKVISDILKFRGDPPEKSLLSQVGLELVEAINTNQSLATNFNSPIQVRKSIGIHNGVKHILQMCGIEESIEMEYAMDCSRDEEIARQLATEPAQAPVVRRGRGRPRRTPV